MAAPRVIKGRYEIREVLGKGGMGVVYRGYDTVLTREVAIKTLLDVSDQAFLELFHREYAILAHMNHPNIVKILDIGEFEFEGSVRPFFIMPLLPGTALDKLIKTAGQRLTVERAVDILSQTCRGLHAAHEKGLVHRDVKPNNIIVMEDDSVEIIDFGVAHVADARSRTGLKGTLYYMAPEQIELKPPTSLSDIFSLGVVAYETVTRRRPFEGATEREVIEAILHNIPPPASDLNATINPTLARVIHKAMAKQPYHRFATARDLADALQKAVHNEPIEIFDPARIRPRIQRAMKAFEQADYQFASEIVAELEAEGHIDPDLTLLRMKVNQAVRQRRIQQLLESARTRVEEHEFPLALRKVQEALELDSTNAAALGLKAEIEARRSESKIEDWMNLARQHMENRAYDHAREALKNVLELKPKDTRALQFLAEIDKRAEEYQRVHAEKQQLYQSAMEAWTRGEISAALGKLQRVLELEQKVPNTAASERAATYQSFYNQVRSEYDAMNNAYAEAKALVSAGNFSQAREVCNQYLAKYPGNALFQALGYDIGEKQRQELSAQIAEVDRRVEAEPNLDMKVDILTEALEHFPGERHFEQALRSTRDKRDLVNSIVIKARMLEEQGQFTDALSQWEILRNIHNQYPGLNHEIERIRNRRDQRSRLESKTRWVKQIDEQVSLGDYTRALSLLEDAKEEFPADAELLELEKLVKQGIERVGEALKLLEKGQQLLAAGRIEEGLAELREAHRRDENIAAIQRILCDALAEQAKAILGKDLPKAEELIQEALEVDPGHALAKSLRTLALDRKRQESIELAITEARRTHAQGDVSKALQQSLQAIEQYGEDPRLSQLYSTLSKEAGEAEERRARRQASEEVQQLEKEAAATSNSSTLRLIVERMQALYTQYEGDADFQSAVGDAGRRVIARLDALQQMKPPAPPPAPAQTKPASTARLEKSLPKPAPPAAPKTVPPAVASVPPRIDVPQPPASSVPESATVMMRGDAIPGATRPEEAVRKPPSAAAVVGVKPKVEKPKTPRPAPAPAPKTEEAKRNVWVIGGIAAVLVLVVLSVAAYMVLRKRPAPTSETVEVTPQPAAPQPAETPAATPPAETALHVFTDLENGSVSLDGVEVGRLKEGQLNLDGIAPGKHNLGVVARDGRTEIAFETQSGALPRLDKVAVTGDLKAVAIASLRSDAQVLSSSGPLRAVLDGKDSGEVGPAPLTVKDLSSATHDLVLQSGKAKKSLSFQTGPAPSLMTFISADRNVGSLLVRTGEDGVTVTVDGKKLSASTSNGQIVLTNLVPRQYSISVSKSGFQPVPARTVSVEKGEVAKVSFALSPITTASLVISGAPPSAKVLLDGASLGTIRADGGFTAANVQAGQHVVELRRDGFEPTQISRDFSPGQTVTLSGPDVALAKAAAPRPVPTPTAASAPPRLEVLSLPGAQVTIDQQALGTTDASGKFATDKAPTGDHTIYVSAKGYLPYQQQVSLHSNQVTTIKPRLVATFHVVHKHMMGQCSGTMTVGNKTLIYKASGGNDSFEYPFASIKGVGAADFGWGFYIEPNNGKRMVFHGDDAKEDLRIILAAMSEK